MSRHRQELWCFLNLGQAVPEWHLVNFPRECFPGEAAVIGCAHSQMFHLFLLRLWPPCTVLFYDFIAAVRTGDGRLRYRGQGFYISGPGGKGLRDRSRVKNDSLVNRGVCFLIQQSLPLSLESELPEAPRVVLMAFLLGSCPGAGCKKLVDKTSRKWT